MIGRATSIPVHVSTRSSCLSTHVLNGNTIAIMNPIASPICQGLSFFGISDFDGSSVKVHTLYVFEFGLVLVLADRVSHLGNTQSDNGQKSPGCRGVTLTSGNARSATRVHFFVMRFAPWPPRSPVKDRPSPKPNRRQHLSFCPNNSAKSILIRAADGEGPSRLEGSRSITTKVTRRRPSTIDFRTRPIRRSG